MIEYVQSTSDVAAKQFLDPRAELWSDLRQRFADVPGPRIAWVAIEPWPSPLRGKVKALLTVEIPDRIALVDEINDNRDPKAGEPSPSVESATQIVRFLEAVQAEPKKWAVLVHCHAGRSRSPAVAQYVQERWAPMDRDVFSINMIGTCPNRTLLRRLREVPRL